MKILFANAMYAPDIGGGAEIMLKVMAEGASRFGHSVEVLAAHDGVDRTDEVGGLPVHRLKLRNIYWPLKEASRGPVSRAVWHGLDSSNIFMRGPVSAQIRAVAPELIVTHNLSGLSLSVWQAASELRIPVVHVLHDYYLLCPRSTKYRHGTNCASPCGSCRTFRWHHREVSQSVKAVVGVSRAVLDAHLEAGLFEGVTHQEVIYNARQQPMPFELGEPASRSSDKPRILGFIGSLSEVKGILPLLQKLRTMTAELPPFELWIAGSGSDEFEAQVRAASAEVPVRLLGQVNAFNFFQQIDVAIVPSVWHDPLPGVVYEAIGQNVPVLGSRRGGIPEMIQNEVTGLLFDPDDSEDLKRVLLRALGGNLLPKAGATALRNTVATWLDEDRMLAQYDQLYCDVAKRGTRVAGVHVSQASG